MKTTQLLTVIFVMLICGKGSAQQIRETPSKYPPLYIINGVAIEGKHITQKDSTITIHSGHAVREFKTSDIQSIYVLKDEEAMKRYGHKGAHGAIRLVTKTAQL